MALNSIFELTTQLLLSSPQVLANIMAGNNQAGPSRTTRVGQQAAATLVSPLVSSAHARSHANKGKAPAVPRLRAASSPSFPPFRSPTVAAGVTTQPAPPPETPKSEPAQSFPPFNALSPIHSRSLPSNEEERAPSPLASNHGSEQADEEKQPSFHASGSRRPWDSDNGSEDHFRPADHAFLHALSALSREIKDIHHRESSATPAAPSVSRPKPRTPDPYDGSDPLKLNTFLVQLKLYFAATPSLASDEDKVTFACSYLKGNAFAYFQPELIDDAADPEWLHSYSTFVQVLQENFGAFDATAEAEAALDQLKMGDRQRISKYNVLFQQHSALVSWGPAALQHRYYQGLPDRIKDALLNHPKPGSLARLRSLAQAIDQRHWEREAERTRNTRASEKSAPAKSSTASTPSSKSSAPSTSKSSSSAPRAPAASKDSTHLGANGKLTPEERQRRFDNELCLFCGGAGHKANKCLKSQKKAKGRAAVTEPAEDAESTAHISDTESKN